LPWAKRIRVTNLTLQITWRHRLRNIRFAISHFLFVSSDSVSVRRTV